LLRIDRSAMTLDLRSRTHSNCFGLKTLPGISVLEGSSFCEVTIVNLSTGSTTRKEANRFAFTGVFKLRVARLASCVHSSVGHMFYVYLIAYERLRLKPHRAVPIALVPQLRFQSAASEHHLARPESFLYSQATGSITIGSAILLATFDILGPFTQPFESMDWPSRLGI
jgi:hypothetical protein